MVTINNVRALFISNITSLAPGQKDAYYRFKNNEDIDWRKILYIIGKRFKMLVNQHGQSGGTSCFILDDTKLPKSNSQSEGVSNSSFAPSYCLVVSSLKTTFYEF